MRESKPAKRPIGVRLPIDLIKRIRHEAARRNVSVQSIVTTTLASALPEIEIVTKRSASRAKTE